MDSEIPQVSGRLRLAGGTLNIDSSNLRFLCRKIKGMGLMRFTWGGSKKPRLRQAWDQALRYINATEEEAMAAYKALPPKRELDPGQLCLKRMIPSLGNPSELVMERPGGDEVYEAEPEFKDFPSLPDNVVVPMAWKRSRAEFMQTFVYSPKGSDEPTTWIKEVLVHAGGNDLLGVVCKLCSLPGLV